MRTSPTHESAPTIDALASPRPRRRSTARQLAQIAIFAALIAALTLPGGIPLGFGVPVTLQTLGVMLAGVILGARVGALAVTAYVALGLAGLPIFSGGTAGLGVLFGPTGGYLLGFVLSAYMIGWLTERFGPKPSFWRLLVATLTGGIIGVYIIGVPWLAIVTGIGLAPALVSNVVFIPGVIIKGVVAAAVAAGVHRAWPGLIESKPWPWGRRSAAASDTEAGADTTS